ncbi:hypothetical protein [Streptomyces sp. NPDC054837]
MAGHDEVMGGTGVEGDMLVGEDGVSGNVVEVREVRDIRAVSVELGSNPET